MDDIQEQHERAVGDAFIAAFNQQQGAQYVFDRRGNEAPDLVYCDEDSQIYLEIVGCYYDTNDAKTKYLMRLEHKAQDHRIPSKMVCLVCG